MATLHDAPHRAALRERVRALRPDAERRWGSMTVDQMLWHVNQGLEQALGETTAAPMKAPLPPGVMRFLVLTLPWPKDAPTMPELVAKERHDFAREQARCLALIDRVGERPLTGAWPVHSTFGTMHGRHWSALMAKHLRHHLAQFGS